MKQHYMKYFSLGDLCDDLLLSFTFNTVQSIEYSLFIKIITQLNRCKIFYNVMHRFFFFMLSFKMYREHVTAF